MSIIFVIDLFCASEYLAKQVVTNHLKCCVIIQNYIVNLIHQANSSDYASNFAAREKG